MASWFGLLPYPLLAAVQIAAQIACAVHVVKTERPYLWLWIIFFFPVIGCLIYAIAEILPHGRLARPVGPAALPVRKRIAFLEKEVTFTDTFNNRYLLGEAYLQNGEAKKAIATLEGCLIDTNANDLHGLHRLAAAYFLNGEFMAALKTLDRIKKNGGKDALAERLLLEARSWEKLEKTAYAETTYRDALKVSSGNEVRCRLGQLLVRLGRKEEATPLFETVVKNGERSPRSYRQRETEWIRTARAELKRR